MTLTMDQLTASRWRPKDYTGEKATELGVAWFQEQPTCYAIGYGGKRTKHDWHFRFPNPEKMHAHIDQWLENLADSSKRKVERKANRVPSDHATGAASIKAELSKAFPGIKFRVRSSSFSMGDDITVHWEFGPTTKEVEAITNKYQEGSFDGMQDLYEYDHNKGREHFRMEHGGAKYVSASRDRGDCDTLLQNSLAALLGINPADQQAAHERLGMWLDDAVWRIFAQQNFPPGAVITGIERNPACTCGGVEEFYRVTFTKAQAVAA